MTDDVASKFHVWDASTSAPEGTAMAAADPTPATIRKWYDEMVLYINAMQGLDRAVLIHLDDAGMICLGSIPEICDI